MKHARSLGRTCVTSIASSAPRAIASAQSIAGTAAMARGSDDAIDVTQVRPSDLACFIYTAGTTGPSKGCMLPQNYIVSLADQIARTWQREPEDIILTPLPLFHFNAISVCVVGTLLVG